MTHTLFVYDRNIELIDTFINAMAKYLNESFGLSPDSEELKLDLNGLDNLKLQLEELRKKPTEPETPSSDRQIFLLKKHFIRAIRVIKQIHADGEIAELKAQEHRSRLIKNSLLLEVKAYQMQGSDSKSRGETSNAANFYKHAKELLVQNELAFSGKTELVKEISKSISALYVTNKKDPADADNTDTDPTSAGADPK